MEFLLGILKEFTQGILKEFSLGVLKKLPLGILNEFLWESSKSSLEIVIEFPLGSFKEFFSENPHGVLSENPLGVPFGKSSRTSLWDFSRSSHVFLVFN